MNTRIRFEFIVLFGLWLFATVMNLNKAYHMDDTVHLETAQWILQSPLKPMSGFIHWDENTEPIHVLNQPHLYFYLLAGWGYLFGFSEVSTHLFQSIFTLACILLIYLIARLILNKGAIFITALLVLNPAFVISQNLMVDIPLLALWLGFYYLLIKPEVQSETRRFALAGFIAGCACLVKYSAVVLIPVLLICLLIKRKYSLLWTVGIPIGMLALWSAFNYLDYGAIHILGRPSFASGASRFSIINVIGKGLSWVVVMGSILPYSPLFFSNLWPTRKKINRSIQIVLGLILTSLFLLFGGIYVGLIDEAVAIDYLLLVFFGNGLAVCFLLLCEFKQNCGKLLVEANSVEISNSILVLYLWLFSGASFIILLSPFMAVRHNLLVIVPLTLLLAHFITARSSLFWKVTTLCLSIFLTLALGISDWLLANYYREKAALIRRELPSQATVYFTGHWGWQWYAKQNGMIHLESLTPQVQAGDYLVHPGGIHQQRLSRIPRHLQLTPIREYSQPATPLTFFKTDRGRFYASSFKGKKLPWLVNWQPFGKIMVYQVQTRN